MNYTDEEKQKGHQKQIYIRIQLLFSFVFVIFAALILRLAFVQIVNGEEYEKTANERSINRMLIQAPRGKIYDKNGLYNSNLKNLSRNT